MSDLHPANAAFGTALNAALAAVQHLNDQGAIVLSVDIRGPRPIVRIDGQRGLFLQGAMKRRWREGWLRRVTLVAPVHGCQVEWTENYPVAREALPA
jgi:hypothetical protein